MLSGRGSPGAIHTLIVRTWCCDLCPAAVLLALLSVAGTVRLIHVLWHCVMGTTSVPGGAHVRQIKSLLIVCTTTSWFALKSPNLFHGECPRLFCDSDREKLHTSSMCPFEDLTWCFLFCFLPDFSSVKVIRKKVDHLSPNIFGEKKDKLEVGPRDGHV